MHALRSVRIGFKLFMLVSMTLLFMVGIFATGNYFMQQVIADSQTMYQNNVQSMRFLAEIRNNSNLIDARVLELITVSDTKLYEEIQFTISDRTRMTDELFVKYQSLNLEKDERASFQKYLDAFPSYLAQRQKVIELALQNRKLEATAHYTQNVFPARRELNGLLSEIITYNEEMAENLAEKSVIQGQRSFTITASATMIAVLLSIMIGWFITRMITKPLQSMQSLMSKAETGDLTVQGNYQSRDEIGRLMNDFNKMTAGLRENMGKVSQNAYLLSSSAEELKAGAEQTTQATNQIATAIQEVATGADHQLKSAEESSRSISEMVLGIQRIAESSGSASESSIDAAKEAGKGNETIHQVIVQMNSIRTSVLDSADVVKQLRNRSDEIEQIVEVIVGISAQTNLLALNAAIEAARAGEHGRGFSIVADEVRKLAEQSKESADHITSLIQLVQHDTQKAVVAMEKGSADVEVGTTVVQKAGEAFELIEQMVQHVAEQIQDVSASSEELLASSEQVSDSVQEMESIAREALHNAQNVVASAQEQLASMEEVTNSTDVLNEMARELEGVTSKFKV